MRTGRGLILMAVLAINACTLDRAKLKAKHDYGVDQGEKAGDGPTADDCYNAGWLDCEDEYLPDAAGYGCGSAYDDGYCDCEAYWYGAYYYCP